MRQTYTFQAFNPRHNPAQSDAFADRATAITWAADAASSTGYHSEVSVTCYSRPDAEYGDHVIDTQTNVLGVVMAGSRDLLDKRGGAGYPHNA